MPPVILIIFFDKEMKIYINTETYVSVIIVLIFSFLLFYILYIDFIILNYNGKERYHMFNTYQNLGLLLNRLMINYIDELAKV